MFLFLGFFNHFFADEQKGFVTAPLLKKFRFDRNFGIVFAAVFIVSNVPVFESIIILRIVYHNISLKIFLWIAVLIAGLSSHLFVYIFKISCVFF